MLFKPSKYLTLVVYEDSKATKCFQFPKSQLKIVLTLIPLIVVFSLGISTLFLTLKLVGPNIYGQRSTAEPGKKFKDKIEKIELENEELKNINIDLLAKINSAPISGKETIDTSKTWPSILHPSIGMKDLTINSPIKLENFTTKAQGTHGVQLNFNISHNDSGDNKTSGYILVLLKAGNSLLVYPKSNENIEQNFTAFNLGETFTVHRFRPVEAIFPDGVPKATPLWFKVFIFNRSGDLLQKQTVGPYNF